jgi:hypothetical protein
VSAQWGHLPWLPELVNNFSVSSEPWWTTFKKLKFGYKRKVYFSIWTWPPELESS